MENNAEISNIEINESENTYENDYHYVGVVFENKSGYGKPYSSKIYEYKTKQDLREGQVVKVNTVYGESKVVIVKEDIPEDQLQFKELDKIKEI